MHVAMILKSFEFLDAPMLRTLYKNVVHPYLDHTCVVWCPFQLGDMRVIKKVQRGVTKIVQSRIEDKSYYDHLVSLNLPSLLYRRRMEVMVAYLIVKGLKRISFDRLFTYCDLPTRSNGYKLYIRIIAIPMLRKFYSQKVSMIGTVYPETSLNL